MNNAITGIKSMYNYFIANGFTREWTLERVKYALEVSVENGVITYDEAERIWESYK